MATAPVLIGGQARTFEAAPSAPAGVVATAYAGGRANVSWTPAPGASADRYVVQTAAAGGRIVAETPAVGTDATVAGLAAGAAYTFRVIAANAAGAGSATRSAPILGLGPGAPAAPAQVTLAAAPSDNRVTVSWVPGSPGPAGEGYELVVAEAPPGAGAPQPVGTVLCAAPCRTETLDVDPGAVVTATITAVNPFGRSAPVAANQVVAAHPCALACVVVDASRPGPVESHPASGFLHAIGPRTSRTALAGVGGRHWRVGVGFDQPHGGTGHEDIAAGTLPHTDLTELLSDDWIGGHHWASGPLAGYAVPPWLELDTYRSWLTAEVRDIESQGRALGITVRWWEVQNEPFGGGYYSPGADAGLPPAQGGAGETSADFEAQYVAAYQAIKAADPRAQVVAPSLVRWAASPPWMAAPGGVAAGAGSRPGAPGPSAGGIDMRTFLDAAVVDDAPPDAIAWHENDLAPRPDQFAPGGTVEQPDGIETDVGALRRLLAARPSLGHPGILVNEYGDPRMSAVPGWDVGRLAALDDAGVTEANRSCYGTCGDGFLDGLLAGDGVTPLAGYWVYVSYAAMTGRRVPLTTSFRDVTGLGVVGADGSVRILLGRHQGCGVGGEPPGPAGGPARPAGAGGHPQSPADLCAPAAVPVSVRLPSGSSTVTVTAAVIPRTSRVLPAPVAGPAQTIAVHDGSLAVATPTMADGDAVVITIRPA